MSHLYTTRAKPSALRQHHYGDLIGKDYAGDWSFAAEFLTIVAALGVAVLLIVAFSTPPAASVAEDQATADSPPPVQVDALAGNRGTR